MCRIIWTKTLRFGKVTSTEMHNFGRNFMKKLLCLLVSVMCLIGITACSDKKENGLISGNDITPMPTTKEVQETIESVEPGKESMTASLVSIDSEKMQIIAKNIYNGENWVLSYNGGTDVRNMYDEVVSMGQMDEGEIVDITFDPDKKKAKTIYGNKEAFRSNNVRGLKATKSSSTITFGSAQYFYTDTLVVLSSGRQLDPSEIMNRDIVTVRGINNKIYSISIDKGHGYLSLTGTGAFIGGVVEIGRDFLYTVSENMTVVVPEGEYTVTMSNNGTEASKLVYVAKDMTMTLDFGEYRQPVNKTGTVEFQILPKDADLFIEGEKQDYSSPIMLEYGTYIINLVSDDYPTYTTKLTVSSTYQIETFDLKSINSAATQKETEATENPTTGSTNQTTAEETTTSKETSSSTDETTSTTKGVIKLTISSPEGADVYIDNVLVGTAPVTVNKDAGEYVITFKKAGYQTKSYIVDVESSDGEQTLSFPAMSEE